MNDGNILGFIVWGVVTVGIGGLGIYLLASSIQSNRDAKDSLSWPFVIGEITELKIDIQGGQDSNKLRYLPIVNYVYQVGANIYDSKKIAFGQGPNFNKQQAVDDFIAQYQAGENVRVYFHPNKPQKSVLKREALGTKSGMISGIVLIMVMLAMICSFSFFMRLMG